MLEKDIEVGKRYKTRDGQEVTITQSSNWGVHEKQSLYVVYFMYKGLEGFSDQRCIFGNGPGRGTTSLFTQYRGEDPYELVESLDDYEPLQLSLFED